MLYLLTIPRRADGEASPTTKAKKRRGDPSPGCRAQKTLGASHASLERLHGNRGRTCRPAPAAGGACGRPRWACRSAARVRWIGDRLSSLVSDRGPGGLRSVAGGFRSSGCRLRPPWFALSVVLIISTLGLAALRALGWGTCPGTRCAGVFPSHWQVRPVRWLDLPTEA